MQVEGGDTAIAFGRIGQEGSETPVMRHDGTVYDLRPFFADIDGGFLSSSGIEAAATLLRNGDLEPIDIEGMRAGAPIARPSAVICIGQNYAAHAAESGDSPPSQPIIFFKHPNTVVGPEDAVPIPPGAEAVDWEVELGVVIGRRTRYLGSEADAERHIAGVVTSNDMSEREYQMGDPGGQWSRGKSCEAFNPLGPWLVANIDPSGDFRLRSWVNGEPRQDSSTADMIFGVAHIVWYLSQYMVLEPGDVINTGSPEGVGLSGRFPYLKAGDTVEIEVEGLGRQRQEMVAVERVGERKRRD